MQLDQVPVPDTPIARAALEVATEYCSPALRNHSIRAYLFAAAYGELHGLGFDAELLYVAAMLHDIGLVAEFDNHAVPFEDAGGHVAWVFGAGAGWPVRRRQRVAEVIVRHMWAEVDPAFDPEGHLLCASTGLDISGRDPHRWPAELRAEVVRALPRLDLAEEFTRCFTAQATRKPDSLAARYVAAGIADRLAANPLERD